MRAFYPAAALFLTLISVALPVELAAEEGVVAPVSGSAIPISVVDLIRLASIGDPGTIGANDRRPGAPAMTSPTGDQAAVIVRRGNATAHTNDAELLLYSRGSNGHWSLTSRLARFASSGNFQPTGLLRWASNGKAVIVAGATDGGLSQVYRIDVATGKHEPVTREVTQLRWYGINESATRVVTVSDDPGVPIDRDPECRRSGCLVTGASLAALQSGEARGRTRITSYDLVAGAQRPITTTPAIQSDLHYCADELAGGLSPDGRYAIQLCRLQPGHWPAWWSDYTANLRAAAAVRRIHSGYYRQWMLLDLVRGTRTRLTSAPQDYTNYVDAAQPVWIDGGQAVVIAGASEPLDLQRDSEFESRRRQFSILAYRPGSDGYVRIARFDDDVERVMRLDWDHDAQCLSVDLRLRDRESNHRQSYVRRNEAWRRSAQPCPIERGTQAVFEVAQSANDRPRLIVHDPEGGTQMLLDPNAWLDDRQVASVRTVTWTSSDGREWRGGLYLPSGLASRARAPLVLQTHGFDEKRYSLTGDSRNFAAQALAARGIVVLQIDENSMGATGPDEFVAVQRGYESAIDQLANDGLIDRDRVALVGWSRTGSYAGYFLTHSRYPIATVALLETADIGWWSYLAGGRKEFEANYGSEPSGTGLEAWRTMAPSFNLERVRSPVLLWSAYSVSAQWDWYARLRMLNKPVEYWYAPDGTHDAFKVEERINLNQLVVDWMEYWLEGERRQDIETDAQYARWDALREQLSSPEIAIP